MSKECSFDALKKEAARVGGALGDFFQSAAAPREVKLAVCSLLPTVGVAGVTVADEELTRAIEDIHNAAASAVTSGHEDQSTISLLVNELLLRNARQKIGADMEFPSIEAARELLISHISADTSHSDTELVKRALAGFFRNEHDLFSSDSVLRSPPATAWDGPQPGLPHQVDAQHRYTFSEQTGYLESIIAYDTTGVPLIRVHYRLSADTGKPHRVASELLQTGGIIGNGARVCINDAGAERVISPSEKNVYFTPAGFVVSFIEEGMLWRQPRAQYLGRLKGFDPLHPFYMRTAYGVVPLSIDSATVLISLENIVFETSADGLRRIGELADSEDMRSSVPERSFTIDHEHITLALERSGEEPVVTFKIKHSALARLIGGPLHKIIGRHPFFHEHVPELIDINGSTTAEARLREFERTATLIALVMHVFHGDRRPEVRAALLHAHQELEKVLWEQARALEELLGSEPQQTLHYPSVRAWIAMATIDPDRAAADLRRMAQTVAPVAVAEPVAETASREYAT